MWHTVCESVSGRKTRNYDRKNSWSWHWNQLRQKFEITDQWSVIAEFYSANKIRSLNWETVGKTHFVKSSIKFYFWFLQLILYSSMSSKMKYFYSISINIQIVWYYIIDTALMKIRKIEGWIRKTYWTALFSLVTVFGQSNKRSQATPENPLYFVK